MCKQKDPNTGEPEGLTFEFNLCEAVATWEQVCLLICFRAFGLCFACIVLLV